MARENENGTGENAMAVINGLSLDNLTGGRATFRAGVLAACRTLARTKPWQGDFDKRMADLGACLAGLVAAYELAPIELRHVGARNGDSGASAVSLDGKTITFSGRLSVVTLLHLFAKARTAQVRTCEPEGAEPLTFEDHVQAIKWSICLFKRCFPISFGRCRLVAGILVNDGRRDD